MIKSKKSLHISMPYETHSGFRIQCFKKDLSMQEVLCYFADRIASESNDVMNMLEQIVKDKQVKAVKKYAKTDVDAIYSMLEEQDPLKGDESGN
jgi:hypothetical protein